VRRRRFERRYRLTSALVAFSLFAPGLIAGFLAGENHPLFGVSAILALGLLIATGPFLGLAVARKVRAPWLKGPTAALAGAFALAVAGAGAIGAVTASCMGRQDWRGAFAGGISAVLALAIVSAGVGGNGNKSIVILIITFFLLLPLANGFWDWLSWRISRWLGRDLLARFDQGGQAWTITWHALADFVFALLFLATLAFALAFGIESYNQYGLWRSGDPVYDLRTLVGGAAANPWTEGFWLTAMLLSTLAPTFLHFALLLASPLVMLVSGSPKRAELAAALDGYDAAEHQDAILQRVGWHMACSQYLAWAGAILLTILLLILFGSFIALIHQGGLADYVASIALFAIDVAERCFSDSTS